MYGAVLSFSSSLPQIVCVCAVVVRHYSQMRAREHHERFAARHRKERRTTFRGVWRKITYSIADDNLYNAKHTVLCTSITYIRLQPVRIIYYQVEALQIII
jgi:hypothetical protein